MNLTRFTYFTLTATRFWSIYVVILIGVVSMFCIEVTEIFRDGIRYFKSGANAMDCTNILCSGKIKQTKIAIKKIYSLFKAGPMNEGRLKVILLL